MITICMFAQVVSRYVFLSSLVWTEELSRYFFILLAFSGLSFGMRYSAHLRIDILDTVFPILKKPFEYLSDLCFVIICFIMLLPAFAGVNSIRLSGQVSPALEIPMWWVYLPFAVGIVLCLIRAVEKYVKKFIAFNASKRGEVEGA